MTAVGITGAAASSPSLTDRTNSSVYIHPIRNRRQSGVLPRWDSVVQYNSLAGDATQSQPRVGVASHPKVGNSWRDTVVTASVQLDA